MPATQIVNASPLVIDLGTQDLSTVQLPREAEAIPQHLPKFFLFTQKGPTTPQLVSGAERINMYGQKSFDYPGPYANHATIYSNLIDAQANAQMIQRVIPSDAGPEANLLLSLDVLPCKVPVYKRLADGALELDSNGAPIDTGTTADGYKVKWVVSNVTTVADLQAKFGKAAITAGDQVDTTVTPNVQSKRYPIFEFKASSQGAWGNNCGIRFWPVLSTNNPGYPATMVTALRAFAYQFAMVEASDAKKTPSLVTTNLADRSVQVTLLPNAVDPTTNAQLYIGDTFIQSYQNLTDPSYPPVFGNFSAMTVYQNNIDTLLDLFYTAELATVAVNTGSDITADKADKYLVNIATFTSSSGAPYTAIQPAKDNNAVSVSQYTNIMAAGGSDGTLSEDNFNGLVQDAMAAYLDPNDPVQDIARNVESIMYDSGFYLKTKLTLCNFIAVRPDTFIQLSTYDVSQPQRTIAEEMSIATTLRTRLQMFPESTYFGTEVARGMITGFSGTLLNSNYRKPVPLNIEIAIKSAIYMGASNGAWKSGYNFDGAPGSILKYVVNTSASWLPASVTNKAWAVGLNWVQSYDRRSQFFPAYKTVYSDDTSVMNSYFTAMAICKLHKIVQEAWREYSGVSNLTDAQLATKTNDYVNNRVSGIFDNRFVVKPAATFTQMDTKRGYSWTLPVKLYANNQKTVMTAYVQVYRMSALTAAN